MGEIHAHKRNHEGDEADYGLGQTEGQRFRAEESVIDENDQPATDRMKAIERFARRNGLKVRLLRRQFRRCGRDRRRRFDDVTHGRNLRYGDAARNCDHSAKKAFFQTAPLGFFSARRIDRTGRLGKQCRMSEMIYPRSPRETMAGWVQLPRFIDKIRLHLAGKLAADYQENFTRGFDGEWLKAAGVAADQFINVVKRTVTDGEVCDWVRLNVKKTDKERAAFNDFVLNRGRDSDEMKARLKWRKEQAGLAHRDDVTCFVDFIDADEKRL